MAIWQFRVILLPEKALLDRHEILPPEIPLELAEEVPWWSSLQPQAGLEQQIDLILPKAESWSTTMRMWGTEDGDDAYVCYADESKTIVEEVSFRFDARSISPSLARRICILARSLGCVLMTADYEILAPDESMVLAAIHHSTAKKFVDDPISTLQNLDIVKIKKRMDDIAKDQQKRPPDRE